MGIVLFLILFLGGEVARTGGGPLGKLLLVIHAATLPFALAAGAAALVEVLAAQRGGGRRALPRSAGRALRAAVAVPLAAVALGALVYGGAYGLAAWTVVAAGGAVACARMIRAKRPLDVLLVAVLAQVAARLCLFPTWDEGGALFAAGLFVAPPLATLVAVRRLRLSTAGLRAAGVHGESPGSLALAPWVALLGLYLALGPLYHSLDGYGVVKRAWTWLLLDAHMLAWLPLLVTAAWVALLARLARLYPAAASPAAPATPAAEGAPLAA